MIGDPALRTGAPPQPKVRFRARWARTLAALPQGGDVMLDPAAIARAVVEGDRAALVAAQFQPRPGAQGAGQQAFGEQVVLPAGGGVEEFLREPQLRRRRVEAVTGGGGHLALFSYTRMLTAANSSNGVGTSSWRA